MGTNKNCAGLDTKTFANDLTLAIKHKSYVPGAAPPPPLSGSDATPAFASSPLNHINNQSPSIPTGPAAAGRKRGFYDRGESDVTSERDPFQAGSPNGRAFKQARRGGGLGRRGYIDPDRPQAVDQINYGGSGGVYPGAAGLNAHAPPYAPTGPANMSGYEPAMNPLEAVRQLQQLQEQINMMAGLAGVGGFYQPPQGYAPHQRSAPQRKRGRCRDYDTKGYCARGPNCLYEHSNGTEGMYGSHNLPAPQMSGQIQLPPEGLLTPGLFQSQNAQDATPALPSFDFLPDFQNFANFGPPSFFHNLFNAADLTQQTEYDPHNATIQPPPMAQQSPKNQRNQRRDNNRQGQGPRKAASRAPFSHSGPMNDKTQTRVVVESIPEENFDEEQVRGFFSQFGSIEEVKMMPYKRLAIVKFDNWDSANAAYRSPKVIFDNRFVKVFWYKDEKHADIGKEHANGSTKNGKRSSSNGFGGPEAYHGDEEEPLDMEEFTRKQEEAQKAHEEKQRVKQEIERKRAELVERQKELQAKQEAEKRRLNDRLGNSRNASAEPGAVTDANGGEENNAGSGSKASAQTEVLRATLARLQEEAKLMGVNPDAQADEDATMSTYASSGYPPRGGRGGYYRGRGGYVPRGSSFRGGRGGGRGNIHAAYAAFSLDNRPRKVALSGVDFSAPEKDEALRQHLFVSKLTSSRPEPYPSALIGTILYLTR